MMVQDQIETDIFLKEIGFIAEDKYIMENLVAGDPLNPGKATEAGDYDGRGTLERGTLLGNQRGSALRATAMPDGQVYNALQ